MPVPLVTLPLNHFSNKIQCIYFIFKVVVIIFKIRITLEILKRKTEKYQSIATIPKFNGTIVDNRRYRYPKHTNI